MQKRPDPNTSKERPFRIIPAAENADSRARSFEIVGELSEVETFAIGKSIRELPRLRKLYGKGRWRKRKGLAGVRLPNGTMRKAELHWYEASGIGKKEFKIKRFVDQP